MSAQAGPSRITASTAPSPSASSGSGKPDRLFVGNLSPTVDEYALVQVFGKFGKITKMDFMFHKSGVLKGKPRGYAFIEFSNKDDALKAMVKLHDRLLRGRKLVVTYANSAPISDLPLPTKGRRHTEPAKPTHLSLLKRSKHPKSASAQIAAMEAKLATMAKKKPSDEDYVPGSLAYPLLSTPGGSGTSSPAPEGYDSSAGELEEDIRPDLLQEEELGMAGAEQAANDLELEMEAELNKDALPAEEKEASPNQEFGQAPITPAAPGLSLPPKPVTSLPPASEPQARPGSAREEAFKKGLAGLPKKPVF